MKIKSANIVLILFIISLFIGVVLAIFTSRPNKVPSLGDFTDAEIYAINPENLFVSISKGKPDVFLPILDTPVEPLLAKPVGWQQEDYLKIANAISLFVWNEPLDDWTIYRMDFQASCQDAQKGFNWAKFYFYKEISLDGKRYYSVHGVSINPIYGYVIAGGNTYPRPIFGWKRIDMTALKVNAEDALIKAEEKGGKEIQLSVNNDCSIYIYMYPELYNNYDWEVEYGGNKILYSRNLWNRSRFRIKSK